MKIPNQSNTLDNELMKLIFKYKDSIEEKNYLSISERESDRKRLNEIYEMLEHIHQKILDSKCYLELGKAQKEQILNFLADETTPSQRLEMFAYIVRTTIRPLVFIHNKYSFFKTIQEIEKNNVKILEDGNSTKKKAIFLDSICSSIKMSQEKIDSMISKIKGIVKSSNFEKWRTKISIDEAEIISQLVARGEIKISISTKNNPNKLKTAIILAEK